MNTAGSVKLNMQKMALSLTMLLARMPMSGLYWNVLSQLRGRFRRRGSCRTSSGKGSGSTTENSSFHWVEPAGNVDSPSEDLHGSSFPMNAFH